MQSQPLVSVLMTAYNRQEFIAEAIESVLTSTYKNWELIIVDDCSKDNTVAIAKGYARKDDRIKVNINEKNLGDYPNRNKAASYATGKYLKYLDSDDVLYPDGLSKMVDFMERFPKAHWGITNFLPGINEQDLPDLLDKKKAYEFHYFQHPVFFASPGQVIMTKESFDAVGGFGTTRMVSDFEMWHKLAQFSDVVLMPGKMVNIREHEGREVSDQNRFAVEYEKIKVRFLDDKNCPLSSKQINKVKSSRRNIAFKIAIRKLLQLKIVEAIPRLKVAWFYLLH